MPGSSPWLGFNGSKDAQEPELGRGLYCLRFPCHMLMGICSWLAVHLGIIWIEMRPVSRCFVKTKKTILNRVKIILVTSQPDGAMMKCQAQLSYASSIAFANRQWGR